MDKKYILIIVVVAVIAVIGGYFLLNNGTNQIESTEHTTLVLSKSAYMEVPDSPNATDKVDKKGIFYYKVNKEDLNITSCSNLSASSSEKEMKNLKDSIATGAKKSTEDGVVIYEKNGTYSIFVRNTEYNDTLLIQSNDKNLLLECWDTVQYHDPTTKIKFDNTTSGGSSSSGSNKVVSAVEKTQSTVQKSTSTSSSSSSSAPSTSASSWGYDWSSSSSGSSSRSSSAGGSASSSSRFDFS